MSTSLQPLGRAILVWCLGLLLGGCSLSFSNWQSVEAPIDLLDSTLPIAVRIDQSEFVSESPLEVSPEMRAYVSERIRNSRFPSTRMNLLVAKLTNDGFSNDSYLPDYTYSAIDTFRAKRGNCLSITMLFVVLAREAGLDARFQLVDSRPLYDAVDGVLYRQEHMTAWVNNGLRHRGKVRDATVDFSYRDTGELDQTLIDDDTAVGLFFSNRGLHRWFQHGDGEAFAMLSRGVSLAPHFADLWINLAIPYVEHGRLASARRIYEYALHLEPMNTAAMAGYLRTVDDSLADVRARKYAVRVQRQRERNPYYHFALAQLAIRDDEYEQAITHLDAALAREQTDHRIFKTRGDVLAKLKEPANALQNYEIAFQLARSGVDKEQYAMEIDRLKGLLKRES